MEQYLRKRIKELTIVASAKQELEEVLKLLIKQKETVMYYEAKKLYKAGVEDREFLDAIKEADGDEKPGIFAGELEKSFFAMTYYGWLVANYGTAWNMRV